MGAHKQGVPYNPFTGNIALSAATIAENSGANTSVGTLSVTAPGASVTWTLTDATGTFVIGGPKSDQVVLGWTQLDFAVTASYSITASAIATDGKGRTSAALTKQFTVSVTASTNPGATSNLPILGIDFRHGVSVSGSSITGVTQSWGGTGSALTGVAAAQPTIGNNGPATQPYCQFAANQYFTYTSTGALSAFDFYCLIAPTSTNTINVLAKNNNAQSFIQLKHASATNGIDQINFRDDSAAAATAVTLSPAMIVGTIYLLRIKFDGTNLVVYVNGTQACTSAAASGHTWTFSQFGRINAIAATGTFYIGAFALYGAVQSAGDLTALTAWFEPWRRQRRFTSSSTGNDASVTPWLQATPLLTIAQSANVAYLRYGDSPQLLAGDVWTGDPVATATSALTIGDYIVIAKYGVGANPIVQGVAAFAGLWTFVSSAAGISTWTAALASDPTFGSIKTGTAATQVTLFDRPGNPYLYTIIAGRSLATAGGFSYTWSAGTISLALLDGMDPNTYEIRLPQAAANAIGLSLSGAPWRCFDIESMFWQTFGARPSGTVNGTQLIRCTTSWNFDDGVGPNQNCDGYYHQSFGNGSGVHSSGHGDGWSQHGTSICTVYAGWFENNDLGGIRPEQYAFTTADRCYIKGNYNDVQQLSQGTGSSGGGITITNSVIVVTSASQNGYAIDFIGGAAGAKTQLLIAYNNTIVNAQGAVGTTIGINLTEAGATGNLAEWNIIKGFQTGIKVAASIALTEDYNDFYLNSFNTAGAGTITAGGHSITTDPLLAADYTLQAGSPCIAGATGSAQTIDMSGRQRPKNVTPNIGAMEYA